MVVMHYRMLWSTSSDRREGKLEVEEWPCPASILISRALKDQYRLNDFDMEKYWGPELIHTVELTPGIYAFNTKNRDAHKTDLPGTFMDVTPS